DGRLGGLAGKSATPPHRKKLRRRESPLGERFITFSCYQRLPLLNHPRIMDFFGASLAAARREHGFRLFAWCLMPEHVHLLIRPESAGRWAPIANSLKTSVALRVLGRWRKLRAPILDRLAGADGGLHYWQPGGGFDR